MISPRLKVVPAVSLIALMGFLAPAPVDGEAIFYESFTAGSYPGNLIGHVPDVGGAAWQNAEFEFNIENSAIQSGGLTTAGTLALPGSGGRFVALADDTARADTVLDSGGVGMDGTTVYGSALIDMSTGPDAHAATMLEFRTGSGGDHSLNRAVYVGTFGSTYAVGSQLSGATVTGNTTLSSGVNFVVLRFNYAAGNDTVDVWMNPASSTDLQDAPDGVIGGADFGFDRVAISNFNDDATGSMDEIRLGTKFSDVANVPEGPDESLKLRVISQTGDVYLANATTEAIMADYYAISSSSGSLRPANWVSLQDQDYEGDGPASGSGDGWEELGTASDTQLAEGFLLGESSIADGECIALGRIFDAAGGSEDIVLQYSDIAAGATVGLVSYETPVEGDTDLDGDVDFDDAWVLLGHYRSGDSDLLWTQGDFTGDGLVDGDDASLLIDNWAVGAGESVAPPEALVAVIPEPATISLLAMGSLFVLRRRRA